MASRQKPLRVSHTRKWFLDLDVNGLPHIFYASDQTKATNDKGVNLGEILHCQPSSTSESKVKFNCRNGFKTLDIKYCEPSKESKGLFPLTNGSDFAGKALKLFSIKLIRSPSSSEPPKKRHRPQETTHTLSEHTSEQVGAVFAVPQHQPEGQQDHEDENVHESSSREKLLETFLKYAINGDLATKVLTSSLRPLRTEYELRTVDRVFVDQLKGQMFDNPVPGQKPLVVVVKGVHKKADFKEDDLDSYELEVIGGNHRRVAITELANEVQELRFKSFDAVLFTEMPAPAAIKLAQGHNIMDQFSHDVTSQDKVKLCRKLLTTSQFSSSRSEWRSYCIDLFQSSKDKMDYVFFLSSLTDRLYTLLLNIIDKFEEHAIKDQKQSAQQTSKAMKSKSKPDLVASKFKPFRGLKDDDLEKMFTELGNGEISFKDAADEAKKIKTLYAAKENFLVLSGISSWDEAIRRFPEYTKTEVLLGFKFKKQFQYLDDFAHFVKVALSGEISNRQGTTVFLRQNPLDLVPEELQNKGFLGVQLVVIYCNKEWGNDNIIRLSRKLWG